MRYPLVEGATATVFALVTWAWHGSPLSAGYCVFGATVIAVSLIEYGQQRAPLAVGATGVALGELLIVIAALWLGAWDSLIWSVVGLIVAAIIFAGLRTRDPNCLDPRGYGRTLLPTAGCWLGGLAGFGVATAVAGLAAWILSAFGCLLVVWQHRRHRQPAVPSGHDASRWVTWSVSVASVPLVTGLVVGLSASLAVLK